MPHSRQPYYLSRFPVASEPQARVPEASAVPPRAISLQQHLFPALWLFTSCLSILWVQTSPTIWSEATLGVLLIGWGIVAPDVSWIIAGWACCGALAFSDMRNHRTETTLWLLAAVLGTWAGLTRRSAVRKVFAVRTKTAPPAHDRHISSSLRHREFLQERLGLVTQALPIGVFEADIAGRCRYLSPVCAEIFGVSILDGFIGTWFDHLVEDDRGEVAASWVAAWRSQEPFAAQCRMIARDAGQRWLHIQARPLLTDHGLAYVASVEDITEQHRARREVEYYTRSLETAREKEREKNAQLKQLVSSSKRFDVRRKTPLRPRAGFWPTSAMKSGRR